MFFKTSHQIFERFHAAVAIHSCIFLHRSKTLGFSGSCSSVLLTEASLFHLKDGERISKWQPHSCNYTSRSFQYPSRILNAKWFLKNITVNKLLVALTSVVLVVLLEESFHKENSSSFLRCILPDFCCLAEEALSLLIFELTSFGEVFVCLHLLNS